MGRILVGLGAIVLVAACGGGGDATPATDGGGGSNAASPTADGGAATEPSAAGASAEATTPPAEPPAEGGGASDACELATAADVEAVFGVSPVTQQLVEGFPATCDFQLDGAPFAAIVLVDDATTAGTMYDAWAADAGAIAVSGLGDRAVYAPSNAILVIQRGDRVASIAYFDDGNQSQDERVELLRQLGQVVAGGL